MLLEVGFSFDFIPAELNYTYSVCTRAAMSIEPQRQRLGRRLRRPKPLLVSRPRRTQRLKVLTYMLVPK